MNPGLRFVPSTFRRIITKTEQDFSPLGIFIVKNGQIQDKGRADRGSLDESNFLCPDGIHQSTYLQAFHDNKSGQGPSARVRHNFIPWCCNDSRFDYGSIFLDIPVDSMIVIPPFPVVPRI